MSTLNTEKLNELNNLKEKGVLTEAEFEIEKQKILNSSSALPNSDALNIATTYKEKIIVLILILFLGGLGVHRFYTGHILLGILYLFSLGFLGIGVLLDLIWVLVGSYKDVNGNLLK